MRALGDPSIHPTGVPLSNIGVQPLLILLFAGGEVCHDSSAAGVNHPGGCRSAQVDAQHVLPITCT